MFIGPGLNTSLTAANAPAPVNLTALNQTVPASGPRLTSSTNSSSSGKKNGAVGAREGMMVGASTVLGALLAGVAALVLA